jgi:Fur family transcriptional regulator, zinc uptake regulator
MFSRLRENMNGPNFGLYSHYKIPPRTTTASGVCPKPKLVHYAATFRNHAKEAIMMTSLIHEAEEMCARAGTRLTDPRRRVLSLLAAAKAPMKAYDLIAVAGPDGGAVKPPTVYRALEFLCQIGIVHRIEQDSTYVACSHVGHGHLAALFVCALCHGVTEVHVDAMEQQLSAAAHKTGFNLEHLVIEGRGTCQACCV